MDIDIRDVGGILVPEGTQARRVSASRRVDAWGIGYEWNGHHFEAVERPLAGASIADLERYPWPDAEKIDPKHIEGVRKKARRLHDETRFVVCARHPYFGVLELGCWMCGFDDFLVVGRFMRRGEVVVPPEESRTTAGAIAEQGKAA